MSRPIDAQKLLLELIQMSVGVRDTLSQVPSDEADWQALLNEVVAHRLMGVTFPAIERLFNADKVPTGIYGSWLVMVSRIREFNERQREVSAKSYLFFQKNGYRSCILKGQAAGQLYPDPLLRQSGDIDIWVEGERKQLVSFLRGHFSLKKIVYHHCEFELGQGMHMEVHFTPSWMNGYFANRRLQRWFASVADEQFSHVEPSLGFAVPTLHFDAVYFLVHIYRHVLEEGVGLRQIYDYYYVLRQLDSAGRERACRDLKQLGLLRFAGALMYVLQKVFALDEAFFLCPPRTTVYCVRVISVMPMPATPTKRTSLFWPTAGANYAGAPACFCITPPRCWLCLSLWSGNISGAAGTRICITGGNVETFSYFCTFIINTKLQ